MPLADVQRSERIVVKHARMQMQMRKQPRRQPQSFTFINSAISSEKPRTMLIHEITHTLRNVNSHNDQMLIITRPALMHTRSRELLVQLIETSYVQMLFTSNSLTTHDIETALFNTSLSVSLEQSVPLENNHKHH